MKNIIEYLNSYNGFNSTFEYELSKHLYIEYCYRLDNIYEKYSEYDDCIRLASFLDSKINKAVLNNKPIKYNKKQLSNFENIFFDTITINIKKSQYNNAEYDINSTTNIVINLEISNTKSGENIDLIAHELVHAYINYLLKEKHIYKLFNISKSGYYKEISKKDTFIKQLLYMSDNNEINSFITQIKTEISKFKDKINSSQDALNILKQSPVFIVYSFMNSVIDDYYNFKLDKQYIIKFTEEFNIINDTNYSEDKVFKVLKQKLYVVNKKLYKKLPKMCIETLNNNFYHNVSTRDFITTL